MWHRAFLGWVVSLLLLCILTGTSGGTDQFIIGGQGIPWDQTALETVALDYTTVPEAIQPRELHPSENILTPPPGGKKLTDIFGFDWHLGKRDLEVYERKLGQNPRFWISEGSAPPPEIIDGNASTSFILAQLVPREEYYALSTQTYSGGEMGYKILENEVYTIDLGIPIPVNRIRFYPPQQGVDRRGVPNRDDAPQGYEVSVALHPQDFLLLGGESYPWHSLEHVIERTLANSKSIVDLTFPVEPVRFIRINLSLMPQAYTFAEIEVYGEGFPPITSYTSEVLDFGEPVNFGRIFWKFTKFRRTPDGEEVADPDAPVRLILETRSGLDDSPLAYYVVGELGEQKEVTGKEYQRAAPPELRSSVRLPGMRSAVAEDLKNWDAWSSPYDTSGEDLRSSDGRQFLQFKFTIESDDVFAFGRLDSVAFEYSNLLAKQVVGEVSLADQPDPPGGIAEAPAGVKETFVYDLRAEFDAPDQSGFDGLWIDVPPESQLMRMEMGEPYVEVQPDSVVEAPDHLLIYFPSHKITRSSNPPVRVTFRAMVLTSSTYFTGKVLDIGSDTLPQSISAGDATSEVSTNKIQVFASQPALSVLSDVKVSPVVLTPNDDHQNDEAHISFRILGVKTAQVTIGMYDTSGQKIKTLLSDPNRPQGSYTEAWDGKGHGGQPVSPGIYLCKIAAHTESGAEEKTIPLVVVY